MTTKRRLACALCLMLPLMMGQYGYYISMLGSESGPCSTPTNVAVLEANFEGSGLVDSCTGDTAGGTASGDCSTGNCPLVDSLSGRFSGVHFIDDLTGSSHSEVTISAVYEIENNSYASTITVIAAYKSAPLNFGCNVTVIPSTGLPTVTCEDATATDGDAGDMVPDTAYNIQISYDGDVDVCILKIDLRSAEGEEQDWGVGAVTNKQCDGDSTGITTIGYKSVNFAGGTTPSVIDQIGLCTSIGLTGKCGRENATD